MKTNEIISAQDASSLVTGTPGEVGDHLHYSIQLHFGTAPSVNGVARLYASNDKITFVEIANVVQAIVLGQEHIWNVCWAGYRWATVIFTPTTDTGLAWSRSGAGPYTVTITKSAHGMSNGMVVKLSSGITAGSYTISGVTGSTFDISIVADPGASGTVSMVGTGTLTAYMIVKEPSNRF